MPIERQKEIKRRRKRKATLKKFKAQYAATKDAKLKELLLKKIQKREPFYKPE